MAREKPCRTAAEAARVAVVAYTDYPWDPRVRREAETLVDEGFAVHAITARPRVGRSPGHLGGVHLHEVPLSIRRGGKLRYVFQYAMFLLLSTAVLLRLHLRRPFTLVHVHSLPDFQVLCALPLKLAGVAVVLDLHEAMPEIVAARFRLGSNSLWIRFAALLERLSCRFADHVIAANDGIRAAVVARGTPSARITAVYNAGGAGEGATGRAPLSDELGLPTGRLLVHAGGINRERDLETLLRALARLPPELEVHLVVAGEGEPAYVAELERLGRDLGIGSRLRFVGKLGQDRAIALMSLAEVGLVTLEANPLTELAWPTRITEFARLRKPLVVPRLAFLRETLQDGAQYYEPGNPDSLARELELAIKAPERRVEAVARAAEVCSRFDGSRMRDRLRSIYRSLEGTRVA